MVGGSNPPSRANFFLIYIGGHVSELDKIAERYDRRNSAQIHSKYPLFSPFQHFSRNEREFWFSKLITTQFPDPTKISMLEIGAGGGDHIGYFRRLGIAEQNIWANELLPDRAVALQNWLPSEQIIVGDARQISPKLQVDIVFQATVFSSILDAEFKKTLAEKMWSLVKPGGLLLWYDFTFDNPWNPDVKGVSWSEARSLFPQAEKTFKVRTTLLPPLGRRVGRLYNFLNFPFLRTHIVAGFIKPK